MKRMILLAFIIISGISFGNQATAQVNLNVSMNIGSQPVWGPAGYDYARYYYLPDVDAYYSIPTRQFVYLQGGKWIFAASLPGRYNYDLYRGYKVVVYEPQPYLRPKFYREKYGRYKGWYGKQPIIIDSRDTRYYVVKGHPMHGKGNYKKYYKEGCGHGKRHKHKHDD